MTAEVVHEKSGQIISEVENGYLRSFEDSKGKPVHIVGTREGFRRFNRWQIQLYLWTFTLLPRTKEYRAGEEVEIVSSEGEKLRIVAKRE